MSYLDGLVDRKTERENKERDTLIEGVVLGYRKTWCQENSQKTTRMNPGRSSSNSGENVCTGLL